MTEDVKVKIEKDNGDIYFEFAGNVMSLYDIEDIVKKIYSIFSSRREDCGNYEDPMISKDDPIQIRSEIIKHYHIKDVSGYSLNALIPSIFEERISSHLTSDKYQIIGLIKPPKAVFKAFPGEVFRIFPDDLKKRITEWESPFNLHRYGHGYNIYHPDFPGFEWRMFLVDFASMCLYEDVIDAVEDAKEGKMDGADIEDPKWYIIKSKKTCTLAIVGIEKSFAIASMNYNRE